MLPATRQAGAVMAFTDVGLVSHVLAVLAYAALLASTLARGGSSSDGTSGAGRNLPLALAALASLIWAGAVVAAILMDRSLAGMLAALQTVKIGAWIGLLLFLLRPALAGRQAARAAGVSAFGVGSALGFVLA
ncbi:hypothetical protein, partial [Sandarakinorhabdus rubra]|uniref:hypothetical protein n=1 Tax=Sandarakinorhabdus rubra TaxID=2672568 RepID=UPI0013DC337D